MECIVTSNGDRLRDTTEQLSFVPVGNIKEEQASRLPHTTVPTRAKESSKEWGEAGAGRLVYGKEENKKEKNSINLAPVLLGLGSEKL